MNQILKYMRKLATSWSSATVKEIVQTVHTYAKANIACLPLHNCKCIIAHSKIFLNIILYNAVVYIQGKLFYAYQTLTNLPLRICIAPTCLKYLI